MLFDLSGLNSPQQEAARIISGPLLILAGAGSGKTRTVTYRIGHMVINAGVKPESILAVSFTNKAATEMQERVTHLLGRNRSKGITLSTFHSLGVNILKKEIHHLGMKKNFSIYDTSDQISIIRDALKNFKGGQAFDKKEILSNIGKLKNRGISAEAYANSTRFDPDDPYDHATEYAYKFYEEKLRFYNAIDFDDILFLTVKLFKENPSVAKKYSEQFQYVMVDEYQDTNPLQFDIVKALTSTHNNICVVGDDDQAIYSFRGADITNILEFEKTFPGAKVIKLEQNYRSLAPILNLANVVIAENKNRKEKKLWSDKPSDQKPMLWSCADTDHEAQVVVDELAKHQSSGKLLSDVAILYRSNTQVEVFEDTLRMNNVPYQILGGQKFYDKKEIKDLIAYMQVILNPSDELALRRILNVPNRGIGTATLQKFLKKSEEDKITLFAAMERYPSLGHGEVELREFLELIRTSQSNFRSTPIPEAIAELVKGLDYKKYIEKEYPFIKQADARKADVDRFILSAERFIKYNVTETPLKDFIEKMLLADSQDNKNEEETKPNVVTLMTLHSSKGLEFDNVYLIGMEEELLPHKKTIEEGTDVAEERRLTYVGITRARKKLIMTYAKERKIYGSNRPRLKSRFLLGFEDYFVEQDRTTFGHLSNDEAKEYKQNFFNSLLKKID